MPEVKKYRSVNGTLGKQPNIGPFPAEQLIPWAVIAGSSYFLGHSLLRLNWVWVIALGASGISTWWILTASGGWRILSKFIVTPNWTRGYRKYKAVRSKSNE